MKVPRAFTGSVVHFNPKGLELLNIYGPNHKAFVCSTFKEKTSVVGFCTEIKLLRKSVVSSANWPILCSVSLGLISMA